MPLPLDQIRKSLKVIVNEHFTTQLSISLSNKLKLTESIRAGIQDCMTLIKEEKDQTIIIDAIISYKERLGLILATLSCKEGSLTRHFDYFFEKYQQALKKKCEEYPELITETQKAERFRYQKKDNIGSKVVKTFKIPVFLMNNTIKKVFSSKETGYWKHDIPLRRMIEFYFIDELAKKTSPLLEITLEKTYIYSNQLHDLTKSVDFMIHDMCIKDLNEIDTEGWDIIFEECEEISIALCSVLEKIELDVDTAFSSVFETFTDALVKVDTVELHIGYFTKKSLTLKRQKLNEVYGNIYLSLQNKLFVLFEDWRFDQDIFMLRFTLAKMRLNAQKSFDEKTTLTLIENIENFINFLENHLTRLNSVIESDFNIEEKLLDEKKCIDRELNILLENFLQFLKKENLPGIVDQIQNTITSQLNKLPPRKTIVNHSGFEIEYEDNIDIESVITFDIVNFELLPIFFQNINKIKAHLLRRLQMTEQTTSEVYQICRLNLNTLLEVQPRATKEYQQILEVIKKDLSGDIKKLKKLQNDLKDIDQYFYKNIRESAYIFSSQLILLTEHNKVEEVFEKLEKRNFKDLSIQTRKDFTQFLVKLPPMMLKGVGNSVKSIIQYNIDIGEKYGLIPLDAKNNTIEIGDFLDILSNSLNKMPYVYERLFRIEALDNKNLFLWREEELNQLGEAYNNWHKGRFSPTIVYAEKGAGTTTLINMFIQRVKPQYRLIKIYKTPHLSDPNEFLEYFKTQLPQKSALEITSLDELIEYLLKLPRKHIIIIENIEHLFLRSVDGFATLKLFLELMAKTNKNIFWVCTSSKYSWKYLNNAQNINKFFGNVIPMKSLSAQSIKEIILKRHQMSGFSLKFEPRKSMTDDKKYLKLNTEEKQQYIEDAYFKKLGQFVDGNVTMLFLFWLRSTKKVGNDTIYINYIDELNYNFFEDLSQNMLVALNMLLIHNGLNEELLAKVMRLSKDEAKLLVLQFLEEEIIIEEHDKYIINPLLYRQVTNLLTKKNFIH